MMPLTHGAINNISLSTMSFRAEKLKLMKWSARMKLLGTAMCVGGTMVVTLVKGHRLHLWPIHLLRSFHAQPAPASSSTTTSVHHDMVAGTLFLCTSCLCYALWFIVQVRYSAVLACTAAAPTPPPPFLICRWLWRIDDVPSLNRLWYACVLLFPDMFSLVPASVNRLGLPRCFHPSIGWQHWRACWEAFSPLWSVSSWLGTEPTGSSSGTCSFSPSFTR